MASAVGARDIFRVVRKGIDVNAVHSSVRKPFRFLLCGDPALVAEMRTLLLSGHDDATIPLDAPEMRFKKIRVPGEAEIDLDRVLEKSGVSSDFLQG